MIAWKTAITAMASIYKMSIHRLLPIRVAGESWRLYKRNHAIRTAMTDKPRQNAWNCNHPLWEIIEISDAPEEIAEAFASTDQETLMHCRMCLGYRAI